LSAFFAFLRFQMPSELALRGVLGNWPYLGSNATSNPFYVTGMGLDDVSGNLFLALRMFLGLCGFVATAVIADRLLPVRRRATLWGAGLGTALFILLAFKPELIPWAQIARSLPFTSLVISLALVAACLRHRRERDSLVRWAPVAMWAVFSLVLLGKMILNARVEHYGFVLAMPATLLLSACLVHAVPAFLHHRTGGGMIARAIALAMVGATLVFFLRWSNWFYTRKDFVIGKGGDAIVVAGPRYSSRGKAISVAVQALQRAMPTDATLLVLPEGMLLNYWLRRSNPSRYTLFLPTELAAHGGEEVVLRDIEAHPPDFIALLHRDWDEFGVGAFGVDDKNGRRIMEWVSGHYERLAHIGAEPFQDQRFGIVILRHTHGPDG
jgi:hypothetical protein